MKKLSELEIDNFICPKYFFHVFGLNSDVNLGVGRNCNALQTCSYWYSYNDTMELMGESGEQIYHFEQLINAGGL